jgi:hypothetical protein
MSADLQQAASAVPGAQVSIGPAVGTETELGPTTTVVAHVTWTSPVGAPLSWALDDPSEPLFTTSASQRPVWELAVMQAAKHALTAGKQVDAISINELTSGQPAPPSPDLVVSTQNREITTQPGPTMAISDVQKNVQSALPSWAAGTSISVVEDAARERVVSAQLALPRDALRVLPVPSLLGTLLNQQDALGASGADIGRVVVSVADATTHEPLYVAGADGLIGFGTSWVSPSVQGLLGQAPPPDSVTQTATVVGNDPTALGSSVP